MTTLGTCPTIPLFFNTAIQIISQTATTLHADLSLHANPGADDVVLDGTQCRFGKVRITDQLTCAVAQHPDAAANLAIGGSGLTDPVGGQAIVLRSGIGTLEIRSLCLRFSQLLTQRVGTTNPKNRHYMNLTLARPGLPRPCWIFSRFRSIAISFLRSSLS